MRLTAQHLAKSYRGRRVVRDVSLEIGPGEVVGLLGPNGAGKTTSFYMIVGLVPPDQGHIRLGQQDLSGLPMDARARLGLGYLPQEASIFRRLTTAQNLEAVLELVPNLTARERLRRREALLNEFHVTHVRDTLGASLSGGERRRVEIARSLALGPRFMLLDEPFAGVDPISVVDIQRIVAHLKNAGIGVLITDHNVRETLGICDRAYIVNEGVIIAQGEPEQVLEDERVRQVYLGADFRL
ncbi:MAG TPA: LPS export ABC transporter ATP-binding protein [Gammaproteobacteria bacterium]|nr:LPS export ABC transporter ATP-binding protein [Gammaproteobacteria bacterium]